MSNNFSNLYDDLFGNAAERINAGRKINRERAASSPVKSDDIHKMCEDVKKTAGETGSKKEEKIEITASAESFNGLDAELNGKVFGQDEFIKKLIISFKRPFVMEPAKGMPRNSVFITGKPFT